MSQSGSKSSSNALAAMSPYWLHPEERQLDSPNAAKRFALVDSPSDEPRASPYEHRANDETHADDARTTPPEHPYPHALSSACSNSPTDATDEHPPSAVAAPSEQTADAAPSSMTVDAAASQPYESADAKSILAKPAILEPSHYSLLVAEASDGHISISISNQQQPAGGWGTPQFLCRRVVHFRLPKTQPP